MGVLNLVVIRHGEAENSELKDFERALTPQGRAQALAVGAFLRNTVSVNLFLYSDAVRTRQTFELAFSCLTSNARCLEAQELYRANRAKDIVALIESQLTSMGLDFDRTGAGTIAIVGHNPVVSLFCSELTGEVYRLSPGSAVWLSCEMTNWSTALHARGLWIEKRSIIL